MGAAVLDIQCVLGANSKYVIKEMSVIDVDSWTTQHWIFKHTFNSLHVNKWLERNYHQIPIQYGDVEYKELERILHSLKFDYIYIKGEQKRQIIRELIPRVEVINLEDIGCPRLNELCDEDSLPNCTFHMKLNTRHCTFRRVFALKKWFINNS